MTITTTNRERYSTRPHGTGHAVIDRYEGRVIDTYLTPSGARYGARLLNLGIGCVIPHALVGTRITADQYRIL